MSEKFPHDPIDDIRRGYDFVRFAEDVGAANNGDFVETVNGKSELVKRSGVSESGSLFSDNGISIFEGWRGDEAQFDNDEVANLAAHVQAHTSKLADYRTRGRQYDVETSFDRPKKTYIDHGDETTHNHNFQDVRARTPNKFGGSAPTRVYKGVHAERLGAAIIRRAVKDQSARVVNKAEAKKKALERDIHEFSKK